MAITQTIKKEMSAAGVQALYFFEMINGVLKGAAGGGAKAVPIPYHIIGDKVYMMPPDAAAWVMPILLVPNRNVWIYDIYGTVQDGTEFYKTHSEFFKDSANMKSLDLIKKEEGFLLQGTYSKTQALFKAKVTYDAVEAQKAVDLINGLTKYYDKLPEGQLIDYAVGDNDMAYLKKLDFPVIHFMDNGEVMITAAPSISKPVPKGCIHRVIFDRKCFLRVTAKDDVTFQLDAKAHGKIQNLRLNIVSKEYYLQQYIRTLKI